MPFDAVAACAAATSHGSYVSQVSHASLGEPDHATLVREAAHSTCGKKVHASHPPKAAKTHPAPGRKHSPTSEPTETPTPTTTATTAQVLPTESSRRNQHASGGHSRH